MFGAATTPRPIFGQQPATSSIFGRPTTSTPAFGAAATPSLFGAKTTSTTAGPSAFGQSAFGQQKPAGAGFTFGSTPASTAAKPAAAFTFGTPAATSSAPVAGAGTAPLQFNFNQQAGAAATAQPAAAPNPAEQLALLAIAVSSKTAALYGDERDGILRTLNQLQASIGSGRAYYAPGAAPVELTAENPFCRFKTVSYSRVMGYKDEDGCVGLTVAHAPSDVDANRQLFLDGLFRIFGSRPTITTHIEGIRPLPENKCEVVIHVTEAGANGLKRRIPSHELGAFLCSAPIQPQLQQQLAVENVAVKADLSDKMLYDYLISPPQGMDPLLWVQAVKSNPDPNSRIPIQILGFKALHYRHQLQLEQSQWHEDLIQALTGKQLTVLESNLDTTEARVAQVQVRQTQLGHRLLKILTQQHHILKQGYALDVNEESLQTRMEALCAHLTAPLHCRSRLTELVATVRSQPGLVVANTSRTGGLMNVRSSSVAGWTEKAERDLKDVLQRFQDTLERVSSQLKRNAGLAERMMRSGSTDMVL
jgi:hypothetical protein